MRSAWMLLALASVLALAPATSAQAPDPAPVVDQACALLPADVSDALPACPRQEPAVPVTPAKAHDHKAPAPPPANPEDAQQLADTVKGQLEGAAEDPSTAPDRAVAIVAAVIQFVRDFLGVPAKVGDAVSGAFDAAAANAGEALAIAKGAVAEQMGKASDLFTSLWQKLPVHPSDVEKPEAPTQKDVKKKVGSLVDDALRTAGVPAPT